MENQNDAIRYRKKGKLGAVSKRFKNSGTFSGYVTKYFVALLAVSAVILVATLLYSSNIMLRAERKNEQKNMQIAADSLEKQFQIMERIVLQIGIMAEYQPNVLRLGTYRDIAMLENFKKYTYYSPLSVKYFLAYPSEKKKIYLSEGSTTYFSYYGPMTLGIPLEQEDEMYWQILNETEPSFLHTESHILSVFPVRFYGYDSSRNAVLCFVLTNQQIQEYLEQVCAGLPEQYALMVKEDLIFNNTDMEMDQLTGASDCISVMSSGGMICFYAPSYLNGWQLFIAQSSPIFYVIIVLYGALILLMALMMARTSMRPLIQLIEKYIPDDSKFEYNFKQLDSILDDMAKMNNDTRYQLRNHLLNLILRGESSEGLLERWSITGIVFERALYCVCLVKGGGEREDTGRILEQELKEHKNPNVDFYIVVMEYMDAVAVVLGYDKNDAYEQMAEILQSAAYKYSMEVYPGRPVDSPKRLPLSMVSAQTAGCYSGEGARQAHIRENFLAERLVTSAITGNQEAMDETGRDVVVFLTNCSMEGPMRMQNLYYFLQIVISKAEEQGLELDSLEINSLVLLPDISMMLGDLQKMLLRAADTSSENRITGKAVSQLLVEYVIANAYNPDINLQEMADCFGLSADYISSIIKRETGYAFKEYLTMLRIAEGKRLLTEDKTLTVNAVAIKVGYRKTSNFSKKFKELTGMQPSQLR